MQSKDVLIVGPRYQLHINGCGAIGEARSGSLGLNWPIHRESRFRLTGEEDNGGMLVSIICVHWYPHRIIYFLLFGDIGRRPNAPYPIAYSEVHWSEPALLSLRSRWISHILAATTQQMIFRDLKAKWRAPRSVKADSSHPEPEADLGNTIAADHALVILTWNHISVSAFLNSQAVTIMVRHQPINYPNRAIGGKWHCTVIFRGLGLD